MGMARTSSRTLSRAIAGGGARLLRSRTLMRAPIWTYRAGLGFVFGSRLLMLEHIGRKSSLPRQVVLEVVGRPAPDTVTLVFAVEILVCSLVPEAPMVLRDLRAGPSVRRTA